MFDNDFKSTQTTGDTATTIIREMRADISLKRTRAKDGLLYCGRNESGLKQLLSQLTEQTAWVQSGGKLVSTLRATTTIDTRNPKADLTTFMSQRTNVIHGTEYVYDADLSSNGDYVFVQKVADGEIMTGAGQVHLFVNKNKQLTSYTQTYVNHVKTLREKAVTISEKKALVALYQYNQVASSSRVVWARVGNYLL